MTNCKTLDPETIGSTGEYFARAAHDGECVSFNERESATIDLPAGSDVTPIIHLGSSVGRFLHSDHPSEGLPACIDGPSSGSPAHLEATRIFDLVADNRFPTAAEALKRIAALPGLSETRRRDMRSAINMLCRFLGHPPEIVELNPSTLSYEVASRPAKAFGLKRKAHQNFLTNLRSVLRAIGVSDRPTNSVVAMNEDWRRIWEALDTNKFRWRLTCFFAFCSVNGISPDQVDERTIDCFVAHSRQFLMRKSESAFRSRVLYQWNRIATQNVDPRIRRIARSGRKPRLTIAPDLLPATFRNEVERFGQWLSSDPAAGFDDLASGGDHPARPAKPSRASTVEMRIERIHFAAGALCQSGVAVDTLKSLRDLYTPHERVRTIIRFLRSRGAEKKSSYVVSVIQSVARAAAFSSPGDMETQHFMRDMVSRVSPPKRMSVRTRDRLRALIEPKNRAQLLALPSKLMKEAAAESCPVRAARLARNALALQILATTALRVGNVRLLEIDRHIRFSCSGRRLPICIELDRSEVKNDEDLEKPLSSDTAEMLVLWLKKYRAQFTKSDSKWLFPGDADAPISKPQFRTTLTQEIDRNIGVRIHIHVLRAFCGWLYLTHHPGDYETVRKLLGHKSIATTAQYYIAFERMSVAERFHDVVLKERRAGRLLGHEASVTVRQSSRKASTHA